MSSSPSTSPVFTIHRVVKDAADAGDITNRALGMNMHGYKTGAIRVVPSANANPVIEVLFWSEEAGKFVSRVHAVESGGFGDGVAFDLSFKAFGGIAFVKVTSGVGSGDTVTITMAGSHRQAAESDVAAWLDQIGFTNGDDERYWWDPINLVLRGPFGPNEIAWGMIYGDRFPSVFEACVETTGYTETIAGNWTAIGGAVLTADQITAPDPDKLADEIALGAAAGDGIKIVLGSATDNTDQTTAPFFRTDSGTQSFRLQFLLKDGTTATTGDLTATTQWQRFDHTADILAGATPAEVRILNGTGAAAGNLYVWGASVYKDVSFPRQYRTNDTGADQVQAKDQPVWAAGVPNVVTFQDGFALKYVPFWANTEGLDWSPLSSFYKNDTNRVTQTFFQSATDKYIVRHRDGGASAVNVVVTDATENPRYALLTQEFYPAIGRVVLLGYVLGDGIYDDTAWDSLITSDKGFYLGGFPPLNYVNGLISEPKIKRAA